MNIENMNCTGENVRRGIMSDVFEADASALRSELKRLREQIGYECGDYDGERKTIEPVWTVMVYQSRYTPGLASGAMVSFERGEQVTFRSNDGVEQPVLIESLRMSHSGADGQTGYEVKFPDGRFFILARQIVNWEGKC